jgi:hypothetical protein
MMMNAKPAGGSLSAVASILVLLSLLLSSINAFAATFSIINMDDAGEGFNDPSPAITPAPNNSGATLGAQRLKVFQAAAARWGEILDSNVVIRIEARFNPQFCTTNSAVLGFAGAVDWVFGFTGSQPNILYPLALANSLRGLDIDPARNDITATFNSTIDNNDNCLSGSNWWYGIDSPAPANTVDLFGTVFHEIAHGLGFTTLVDLTNGEKLEGMDDVFMMNLEDHNRAQTWPQLSDLQRAASATNDGDLHWIGSNVSAVSNILSAGTVDSHVRMYAPAILEEGSSVAHWDTALTPNEVMEPFDIPNPIDTLTIQLMVDIGWKLLNNNNNTCTTANPIFCDGFE